MIEMKRANISSNFMGSEVIKINVLPVLVLALLFVSSTGFSQTLAGRFQARKMSADQYGKYQTYELEILSDSLLVYRHYSEKGASCDSIIPGFYKMKRGRLNIAFPDRDNWNLFFSVSPGAELLTRGDGLIFMRQVNNYYPKRQRSSLKKKNKGHACPVF